MFIPASQTPSHSLLPPSRSLSVPEHANSNFMGGRAVVAPAAENVDLSSSGRHLSLVNQTDSNPSVDGLVSVGAQAAAEQSADVILGFIDLHLQRLAADGASDEEIETALGQALKGFQQGLGEAKDIINGFGLMTEDLSAGIAMTEQLVLEGLVALREAYLGEDVSVPVSSDTQDSASHAVVTGYREQLSDYSPFSHRYGDSELSALAGSYTASYQRAESVELQVHTQDGDLITLSFNSNQSSQSSSQFASGSGSQGVAAVLAYQRNSNASSGFSFSVEGHLDAGEQEALGKLLQQVAELSEEFFNGDFDRAFAMALEFEMDEEEFSSLSLDLARSTRASIVEAYTALETSAVDTAAADTHIGQDGLVDNLLAMLEQARNFAEPQQLLTDLLANQMAQQAILLDESLAAV